MKVKFSLHIIQDKIPLFKKQGFEITLELLEDIINNPEHIDRESDNPKIIVSGNLDEKHILRIVYRTEDNGIIKAITVYPAEKGRYF